MTTPARADSYCRLAEFALSIAEGEFAGEVSEAVRNRAAEVLGLAPREVTQPEPELPPAVLQALCAEVAQERE